MRALTASEMGIDIRGMSDAELIRRFMAQSRKKRPGPFKGRCVIDEYSGIHKRMRKPRVEARRNEEVGA